MTLIDQDARTTALVAHDRTLLVEAGAGTGKTALMAGRVVRLLADGHDPANVAAITFTELAAGALHQRVTRFVDGVVQDDVPRELAAAFPGGPTDAQAANLRTARGRLDRLSCTTIHGFCKQLIGPYPVETGTDPGATMMDPAQTDIVFDELRDRWLREHLSAAGNGPSDADDLLAHMLFRDPDHAIAKIKEGAAILRRNRTAGPPPVTLDRADLADFEAAVDTLARNVNGLGEESCDTLLGELRVLRETLAGALDSGPDAAGLLTLAEPPRISAMKKDTTAFRAWGRKGKVVAAGQRRGASKGEAERANTDAQAAYADAETALHALLEKASGALAAGFLGALAEIRERYAEYKRNAALMDFDDLLYAARDLLRDHPDVRKKLAERYQKVLVDEFQDTDTIQADILWRLTEVAPQKSADASWTERVPEPGRLFLVGDPKQSIYRFRGADIAAYTAARDALEAGAGERLTVTANFRSQAGILDWVNTTFADPLSAADQPGFEALSATKTDAEGDPPRVTRLDVTVESSDPDNDPTVDDMRRAEATAVADLCRQLVGSHPVKDDDAEGGTRPCRPGDIALIAPVGTSLWIYEAALEQAGLPIATQAGKGAFRRQEVLDLIALARVLADGRDTLALGALLRGPLVGLTEEQLLDCVHALPRDPERADRIPALNLNADPDALPEPVAANTLRVLRGLRARARTTTPFELMAEAVEEMRVRPILERRHPGAAERALANVDLFLELARPYAVRGLKAFARDMRDKWEVSAGQSEGRPDAQQEAVQVITMHSAKGLEWPVVIPVNAVGAPQSENGPQLRRPDDTLHMPVARMGPPPPDYKATLDQNERERGSERVRLWYVACTRAAQLLVLPHGDAGTDANAWDKIVDLGVDALPGLDTSGFAPGLPERSAPATNNQDAETFRAEAERVAAARPTIRRRSPSRHEGYAGDGEAEVVVFNDEDGPVVAGPAAIQGSTTRGLVIHKLLEEVLTGETPETGLVDRAGDLLDQLGVAPADDPSEGPVPLEMAGTVERALACPEIAEIRDMLVPEVAVMASNVDDIVETILTGIADAVATDDQGCPTVVVDWKSDVAADLKKREQYRSQLRDYLNALGAQRGLIVYVTDSNVERVVAD
ncbi:UvrD-helicase domain-containing protein [Rhodovibrio salinarum]|uniref:DNA 3'-5' helicase n=1 Tax=Rhodovibrio salinarum TaxID=1087 RepID=A0A934QK12_9PROT|nr:UvrD-helicase domain-containing protein [Rhodovibrio salinarum]MBK1698298.1 hypothetical protein [Rhodovibrio salinarum]